MTGGGGPEEDAAKFVFESVMRGAELVATDVRGAAPGTCDFAVMSREGDQIGALEVTQLLDEKRMAFEAARNQNSLIEDPRLSHDWYVSLAPEVVGAFKMQELRHLLVPALLELEERGELKWEQPPHGATDDPPSIGKIPIRHASAYPRSNPPRVFLLGPSSSTTVWVGTTHDVVQKALSGPRLQGKRQKLAAVEGDHHLFLWLSPADLAAYAGLAEGGSPSHLTPKLPQELSFVWVAAPTGRGFVAWLSDGETPWLRYEIAREEAG